MTSSMEGTMNSNIDIAHRATLKPIGHYIHTLGLQDDEVEICNAHAAKIRLVALKRRAEQKDGKLILVTAMTPTSAGEGKTLTTIGLGEGLAHIGRKGIIALREPSLGPVFGMKGGATGGGVAQVVPMEDINLHFTGDMHAVTSAHNLLAAMIDNHILKGNDLQLDVSAIQWNRAMDMNDRTLRQIIIGLGGRSNGIPRETGFVITTASEVMAILALASSFADLKTRLGEIVIGSTVRGEVVRAKDIGAHKPMAVLLSKAILPNLVQTIEHTPALIHAGPFANIAHGTNSILADRIGLKLADYLVTECGFGADLGAEKFFDIVCRGSGLWPSAVVIVATCRALRYHGGEGDPEAGQSTSPAPLERGFENLATHVRNLRKFNVPVVVALNRFPADTAEEIRRVWELCQVLDVRCVPHDAFSRGGVGAALLAEAVVGMADTAPAAAPRYLYDLDLPVEEKIRLIATEIYGADKIYFEKRAKAGIEKFTALGYGKLPVCMAKTQSSLSDRPRALGVPKHWTLTVSDAKLAAGAGFLVIVCGDMMLMPGLPKVPAAVGMDIDDEGRISGLY